MSPMSLGTSSNSTNPRNAMKPATSKIEGSASTQSRKMINACYQKPVRRGLSSLGLRFGVLFIFANQISAGDFLRPATWGYGNEKLKIKPDGMVLTSGHPEATLAGTAFNPKNLSHFTLSLRWNFGGGSNHVLKVGWNKPFEWGAFKQCAGWVMVQADGKVAVYGNGKELGVSRIPVSDAGEAALTLIRRPHNLALVSEGKESLFPLPADLPGAGGYLTLRAEGYKGSEILRLESLDLIGGGNRAPLTEAQREAEIWRWEKGQVESNWGTLTNLEQYLKSHDAGRWGFKTDMQAEPGLVKPGEKVRITFRCLKQVPPNSTASVEANCLSESPGALQPLSLQWREMKDGTHEAVVELTPKQAGNWRVTWKVGDEQLSRVFGVVDDGYMVVRILTTSDHNLEKAMPLPSGIAALHEVGLPSDFWGDYRPFDRSPEDLLAYYQSKRQLAFHHRWGDQVVPLLNADAIIPGVPDKNLWRVRDDVQREGIKQTMRLWDLLGLGPLEDLGGYTFSHSTPEIARSLGIKAIDSLCQWQNWRDGGDNNAWLINILGAPTVPYFVAKDDFRKVAPRQGIVALSQGTTSNVRIYSIMTTEGSPQLSFMRQHSKNGEMGETSNIDRFEAFVDLLLAEARYQAEPMFIFVGLENFADSQDWNEANRLGVCYLLAAARHRKVVFAQGADIADYYLRHYQQQPENWFYWPDIYAGISHSHKPPQLPDRIELSNARFHTVHEDGAALPQFFWDFTRHWSEPEWDDQPAIRQKHGLPTPRQINATNCVPRMVDLAGVSATVTVAPQSDGVKVSVVIESPMALPVLPVALWRLPLDPQTLGPAKLSSRARYVRMVDGTTGNLNGVLVCDQVPKGRSTWTMELPGAHRAPFVADIQIGSQVRGRYFPRANGPSAYLWLADNHSAGGVLTLRIPAGRIVTLHYNDGQTEQTVGGTLAIKLDGTWQHVAPMITGLSPDELVEARVMFKPE
jgi:hypothetical protein